MHSSRASSFAAFAVSAALLLYGAHSVWTHHQLMRTGQRVMGTVVDQEARRDLEDGHWWYHRVIEYRPTGSVETFRLTSVYGRRAPESGLVEVAYDPRKPSRAVTDDLLGGWGTAIPAALAALASFLAGWQLRRKK